MPKTVRTRRGGKATARFPPGAATVRFFHQLADERERLQAEANERRRRDHEAFIARMNIPVDFNPHRGTKRKRGEGVKKMERYIAQGSSRSPTSNGQVAAASYSGDKESDPTVLKSHIPELLKLYEGDPNEYNKQQLINLLGRLGDVEEQQKKADLIKELGGKGKKTVFADLFHSQGTAEIGEDLESLSVPQLEAIKEGRAETRKNEAKPWYEKAKNVLETAVVPAIGDVANILGKVIPGLNLITDEIEKVTNHGVHSWDDLGPLGALIEIAPNLARQVIPTSQISNVMEAFKAAKELGTQTSQLDDEQTGGRINPYRHHYRSVKRTRRI